MIIELTDQKFLEEIKQGKVLVDFYATWCGPCKMMHPVIDEVAKDYPELKIIKVDVDQHEDLAMDYGVMSIPTLILFENGEEKNKNVGFTPKDKLVSWLK